MKYSTQKKESDAELSQTSNLNDLLSQFGSFHVKFDVWPGSEGTIRILFTMDQFKQTGPSASTGEHCICIVSDLLWLGLVWSCFVFCLLFLLFYVICAPVLTEGTKQTNRTMQDPQPTTHNPPTHDPPTGFSLALDQVAFIFIVPIPVLLISISLSSNFTVLFF